MTATVANAKQGWTRIPTYAELIKEIDRDRYETTEIRKVFDRNAWFFHESPIGQALNTNNNMHPADLQRKCDEANQSQGKKERVRKGAVQSATAKHFAIRHDKTFVVGCSVVADFGSESEDDEWERKQMGKEDEEGRNL